MPPFFGWDKTMANPIRDLFRPEHARFEADTGINITLIGYVRLRIERQELDDRYREKLKQLNSDYQEN